LEFTLLEGYLRWLVQGEVKTRDAASAVLKTGDLRDRIQIHRRLSYYQHSERSPTFKRICREKQNSAPRPSALLRMGIQAFNIHSLQYTDSNGQFTGV